MGFAFMLSVPAVLAQDEPVTPPGDPETVESVVSVPPEWEAQFEAAVADMYSELGLTGEPGDIVIQTNAEFGPLPPEG
jgi:hypothetical protein